MITVVDPEPDQPGNPIILYVGQDRAGHWLVQESGGRLEGRFVSRDAAWSYARAERHGFPGARIVAALRPLVPSVSFEPARPDECVFARAA